MERKLISAFLIVWILLTMPITVFAQGWDSDCTGSISVTLKEQGDKTPIKGAEFTIYRVATVSLSSNNKLNYAFTGDFEECGCTFEDSALSAKLDMFVENNSISCRKLVTDAYGKVVFANLPLGLYLVKQTGSVADYAACTSFLVTIPNRSAGGYVYDVNASPKTDTEKLTNITIEKVWNTDKSTPIADNVTVQLLRNGVVMKTATLSATNDWKITYPDMPESDAYSVLEINIPKGYTATYAQKEYTFVVTNTASLAQTGQLVWPIPVLAMTGLCLITVGIIVLRKTGNKNA